VSTPATAVRTPGIARRLACAVYDLLLLAAVVVIATFPFLALVGDASRGPRRHLLQAYVVAVAGTYLIAFWTRGGQTLAMKTWGIRLVGPDGQPPGIALALKRYLLAVASVAIAGLGFLWAFVDREEQFLHDRLIGTRLVDAGLVPRENA
jgi:uncharacterized RDD family membrane protein YckC